MGLGHKVLFLIFVTLSHLLIPFVNSNKDFLIFTNWNFFSPPSTAFAKDIVMNNNKSLFRDYSMQIRKIGLNPTSLFHKVESSGINLSEDEIQKIKTLCQCEGLKVVTYNATRFEYFVLKKNPEIIQSLLL